MTRIYLFSFLIALSALAVVDAEALGKRNRSEVLEDRAADLGIDDDSAPVDLGWGPGRGPSARKSSGPTSAIQTAAAPVGGANAHIEGVFGAPSPYPINAINVTLLPNGMLYSHGPRSGSLSAALVHDLWDTATDTHTQVQKFTSTNTFCSAHALFPKSGQLLIAGGETTVNGKINQGIAATHLFDYNTGTTGTLSAFEPMAYKRWYPTLVPLTNGGLLVLGGRQEKGPSVYAPTPEVYTPEGPNKGWRTLTAANNLAYGSSNGSWYYPRAFPAPNGRVFILAHRGEMFYLNLAGTGSITQTNTTSTLAPASSASLPSVRIAPGKILSLRKGKRVVIVDLNKTPPIFKDTAPVSSLRYWSNATVCATGEVVVTGGSSVDNTLTGVAYRAEIYDPATEQWTLGAAAQKPRLYHSSAVCMPDATILTMGGGNPGPVTNQNAEVYYPGYLYKPGGSVASRPSIAIAPAAVALGDESNPTFNLTVGSGDSIARVTAVRAPSVTHAFDAAASFMELSFTQSDPNLLTITAPNANEAMPGYWMIFVINQNGVPSVAKILHLTAT